MAGKNVVATSGFFRALQDEGLRDIVELEVASALNSQAASTLMALETELADPSLSDRPGLVAG